jgi:response regulator NasT
MLKRAIAAGAYSYVRKPFHSADVRAAVALALSRFREAQELQREIKQLKSALSTRKLVEKAKGIIMRAQKLDEEQAHRYLQLESQRRGQSVAELARAVVTADALLHSHNLNKDRILRLTEDEHK